MVVQSFVIWRDKENTQEIFLLLGELIPRDLWTSVDPTMQLMLQVVPGPEGKSQSRSCCGAERTGVKST